LENESDSEVEAEAAGAATGEVDDYGLPAELNMDKYDEEDDLGDAIDFNNEYDDDEVMDVGAGLAGEAHEMEILEEGGAAYAVDVANDFDEDQNDDVILPTDSILLLAMTEDEYSHLEVQVMTKEGSLYTHHDIMLPDFPLCLSWLDCPPCAPRPDQQQQAVGSYVAVGTFDPAIEIWNLDVLDAVEPSAVLGGIDQSKSKKTSKKKKATSAAKQAYLPGSHEGAVMSLSWNHKYRQALASGSADNTLKIWDVTSQTCSYTFKHHQDKVNSVCWHPDEAWLLASSSFDKTLSLVDCRSVSVGFGGHLAADSECVVWDPFQPYHMYVALENGDVICLDIRNLEAVRHHSRSVSPYLSFHAHDKTVTSLHFSPSVKGMLATSSLDKTVKVWDVGSLHDCDAHQLVSASEAPSGKKAAKSHASGLVPKCVAYKTMNVGKLFSLRFSYDDPFTLAAAGDEGKVAIWESDENDVIKHHFQTSIYEVPSSYVSQEEIHGDSDYSFLPLPAREGLQVTIPNDFTETAGNTGNAASEMVEEDWMNDNSGIASNTQDKKKKKKKKM
jgi:periodic tryptophan protein 1